MEDEILEVEVLRMLKAIHAKVIEADESLAKDFQIAYDHKAWMLAFLAICVRLDILAFEYYFNTVFSKKTSTTLMLQKFESLFGQVKPKEAQALWQEILDDYSAFLRGKVGTAYRKLIDDLSSEKNVADKVYGFRNSMVHSYTPGVFYIDHTRPPAGSTGLFVQKNGNNYLYLDRFKEFHAEIYKQLQALKDTDQNWRSVGPKLRIED